MAIQSAYQTVAEQVITFNNNVVDMLSKINRLIVSSEPTVTVNVTDQSGVIRQFNLPSFGYLKAEIERLNTNLNSIYSINDAGALIQPSNGTRFKKVVTVDLNREPNDLSPLTIPSQFVTQKNWFFDGLLNPQIMVEFDLSGQIENNVRKVQVRRYIPEFAKDAIGNFTPLGQAALNSFNNLFRGQNGFTLNDYLQWHTNTPGLLENSNPNYDEQMFDMEPNILQYDGLFDVLRIEEDTVNKKLWYYLNTLNYIFNRSVSGEIIQETKKLDVGDEVIVNTAVATSRYRVLEIYTAASSPKVRFERVEGLDPIPVGAGTLKIYSPVLYSKKVRISVGYNERNVIFVKALNMDNYILSKNWSNGVGFWTNDLREVDSGLSMEQYYVDNVYDYGDVLHDLVAKKQSNTKALTPNPVVLSTDNFRVVQINRHLTDTADSNSLKNKYSQQKNLKSEVQQLNDSIIEKNKQLRISRFASDADRKQFQNELDSLNRNKESKSRLLNSVNTEILNLVNTPTSKVEPVYRVRGFWSFPEAILARGTTPQEVIQFRVQYRYLSRDGKETPIETFRLTDGATTSQKTAAYSNWEEFKTDVRKRVYNASNGEYSWVIEDLSDADTPNINQLDIPIRSGERVEVKIKSISEMGWPESPIESDWSNTLIIDFPDDLNAIATDSDTIQREALTEQLRTSIQSDLSAQGLDDHLSQQIVVNNVTYHHTAERILTGFKDQNGVAVDLFQYLQGVENRIRQLEEKILRTKGELEVIVFRNNQQFVVKNGSELTFNVYCEDYADPYTSAGVALDRTYQNKIYIIREFLLKVRNASVDSPLGLLSNRLYSATSNSDVYNSTTPQVFWVNNQNDLIIDNSTGTTKTQKDNQFIWSVNFDSVDQTSATKLSQNIGNTFIVDNNNSLTGVLSSPEFNVGWDGTGILGFVGNNTSLLDQSKWIDRTVSAGSSFKLLTTIHPEILNLNRIQETNDDKVRTLNSGEQNDINIPLNIYFKMNALDGTRTGEGYEYIRFLGSRRSAATHTKKLKFLMENESENKPFIFTIKFVISLVNNQAKNRRFQ